MSNTPEIPEAIWETTVLGKISLMRCKDSEACFTGGVRVYDISGFDLNEEIVVTREEALATMQRAEPEVTDAMLDAIESTRQFLDCDCEFNKHTDACRRNHWRVLLTAAFKAKPQ